MTIDIAINGGGALAVFFMSCAFAIWAFCKYVVGESYKAAR